MSEGDHIETYREFRELAKDPALSLNEKCGYADAWRGGQAARIYADIRAKLGVLDTLGAKILDIGPGCSELSQYIVEATAAQQQCLTVIDSPEMLRLLPDRTHLTKVEGPFPRCLQRKGGGLGRFDAILAYSVVQTVFVEANLYAFIDAAVQLLGEAGQLLIGDIPNATMRKRLMVSDAGRAYHKLHYAHLPEPNVVFNALSPGEIDDGVVLGLVARMRAAGLHAFVVPQAADLPFANRREDILVVRP